MGYFLKLITGFYINLLAARNRNVVRNPFITSHLEGQGGDMKIEGCDNVMYMDVAQVHRNNRVQIKVIVCYFTLLIWKVLIVMTHKPIKNTGKI
jgi:hypothetical protein